MKAAKWRELTEEELQQKARELNEEIFNLRFRERNHIPVHLPAQVL